MAEKTERNKPEFKKKFGAITATVWGNEKDFDGKKVKFHTVNLQRSYKDKKNEWQNTESLRKNDIPAAILALNECYKELLDRSDGDEE